MSVYPDPPAPRIAYDLDGTIGLLGRSAGPDTFPALMRARALQALNSDASPMFVAVGAPQTSFYSPTGVSNNPWTSTAWDWQLNQTPDVNAQKHNWAAVVFPEPKQVSAIFAQAINYVYGYDAFYNYVNPVGQPFIVQTSQDTTTGEDGTWTTIFSQGAEMSSWVGLQVDNGYYPRTEPASIRFDGTEQTFGSSSSGKIAEPRRGVWRQDGTQSELGGWRPVFGAATRNVLAIRILCTEWPEPLAQGFRDPATSTAGVALKLHVYGTPDTGASDDRLSFEETDGSVKSFDWGDIKQGMTRTQTFQVANQSADKTAKGVTLTLVDSNNSTSPSPLEATDISLDGTNWYRGQIPIPDIPAGQASAPLTLRVQVPEANLLGAWAPRLTLDVEEWA